MKKIFSILIFFNMTSLSAYTLKFDNQTGYPLQAVFTFEHDMPCKKMVIDIPPQAPFQLPHEVSLRCCTTSIRIQRADADVLNRIEYDYEQPKTDEGACTDDVIIITRRSDNVLEIK